jgi:uncharacterized protein YdeI (BOF family)
MFGRTTVGKDRFGEMFTTLELIILHQGQIMLELMAVVLTPTVVHKQSFYSRQGNNVPEVDITGTETEYLSVQQASQLSTTTTRALQRSRYIRMIKGQIVFGTVL